MDKPHDRDDDDDDDDDDDARIYRVEPYGRKIANK